MCLPDFERFEQINEDNPIIGYRSWRTKAKEGDITLFSEHQDYCWIGNVEGPHLVLNKDSGIYSYNNHYNKNYNNYYNNYNYNNYNNYNYNKNYNNYYNYYYNYYLYGIIQQWGRVAIHELGFRSEYAKINSIFTIRELDAEGTKQFINWIKIFNNKIEMIAEKYNIKTISWQDFIESPRR